MLYLHCAQEKIDYFTIAVYLISPQGEFLESSQQKVLKRKCHAGYILVFYLCPWLITNYSLSPVHNESLQCILQKINPMPSKNIYSLYCFLIGKLLKETAVENNILNTIRCFH